LVTVLGLLRGFRQKKIDLSPLLPLKFFLYLHVKAFSIITVHLKAAP